MVHVGIEDSIAENRQESFQINFLIQVCCPTARPGQTKPLDTEERLFADHKTLLTWFHVLLDSLLHPVSVSAAVVTFLKYSLSRLVVCCGT